jgi:hypothetical protein
VSLLAYFEEQWELVGRKLNSELDLVEPIIGLNIGLWSSHIICKEPVIGKQTPWHEDSPLIGTAVSAALIKS